MSSLNQNNLNYGSSNLLNQPSQMYASYSRQAPPQSALSTYMLYQQASAISNLATFYQYSQQNSATSSQDDFITGKRTTGKSSETLSNKPNMTIDHSSSSVSKNLIGNEADSNSSHQLDTNSNKNMFQHRKDWSILHKLPIDKQNPIHIRVEDEGPYGNDEIRCFILSHFGSLNVKEIGCVFCNTNCVVYDRFPLIDGTLFLSPMIYDHFKSIPSPSPTDKKLFISAVCLNCILCKRGHEIKCLSCNKSWQELGGRSFQIGTLYKFDLFAGLPCCQSRLKCIKCQADLLSIETARENCSFSNFSEEVQCTKCGFVANHFVRKLKDIYYNAH
jgi:hypothetical protein